MIIHKKRILLFGLGLVYFGLLTLLYVFVIAPFYFYSGMVVRVIPVWIGVLAVLYALLPLFFLPLEFKRPSDYSTWLLYLMVIGPSMLFPYMMSNREPERVIQFTSMMLTAFILFEYVRTSKWRYNTANFQGTYWLYSILMPIALLITTFISFSLAGFEINLSLADVYERRLAVREIIKGGSLMGYVIVFMNRFLIPMTLLLGLWRKNIVMISLATAGIIVAFSLDGQKSVLFTPLVIIVLSFFIRRNIRYRSIWLLTSFIFIIIAGLMEFVALNSFQLTSYVIKREMFMPALLSTYYWEFFSENPLVYMSDGRMGAFFPKAYDLPTPRVIGVEFFGSADKNANANIFASGFANFGYIGIYVTGVVAALLLKILDSFTDKARFEVASMIAILIGLVWVNGALHTSLLSNGVLVLILFAYTYEK